MAQPAHAVHTRARPDGYRRRRPEETVLYRAVAAHWPAFKERAEELGGLPRFVTEEVEEYLRCGLLEHGLLRCACRQCGHEMLVAFSCKRRGFCPSCLGRRMADISLHLEREVLPRVAIRHWIASLPWGLRALLGYDRRLCAEVASAFVEEMSRSLKRRAKRLLQLTSVRDALTGAVLAVQRVDSACRLNVHFHVLALDGVYVRDAAGELTFHALPAPSRPDVLDVARRTAERIARLLKRHGRSLEPPMQLLDGPDPFAEDEPALASCYAAAAQGIALSGDRAGQPSLRLVLPPDAPTTPEPDDTDPVAEAFGVNVHARQCVHGNDRRAVERLARYITRPPIAQDRLEERSDGTLLLTLKSPWKDGTRAIILEPDTLIARLCAAVPPPRLLSRPGQLTSNRPGPSPDPD